MSLSSFFIISLIWSCLAIVGSMGISEVSFLFFRYNAPSQINPNHLLLFPWIMATTKTQRNALLVLFLRWAFSEYFSSKVCWKRRKKTSKAPQWDGTTGAPGMRSAVTTATSLDTNSIRKQQTLFLLDFINRSISFCYVGWNKTCSFFFNMQKNSLCFWMAHRKSTATVQRSAGSHLQPIQLTGMLESTTKRPAERRRHSVTCQPFSLQPNPRCPAMSPLLLGYTYLDQKQEALSSWMDILNVAGWARGPITHGHNSPLSSLTIALQTI